MCCRSHLLQSSKIISVSVDNNITIINYFKRPALFPFAGPSTIIKSPTFVTVFTTPTSYQFSVSSSNQTQYHPQQLHTKDLFFRRFPNSKITDPSSNLSRISSITAFSKILMSLLQIQTLSFKTTSLIIHQLDPIVECPLNHCEKIPIRTIKPFPSTHNGVRLFVHEVLQIDGITKLKQFA